MSMESDLAYKILKDLEKGDNHVNGIADNLDKNPASISRALSGLQALGCVDSNRNGKKVEYHITSSGVDYLSMLEDLNDQKEKLENLKKRLGGTE